MIKEMTLQGLHERVHEIFTGLRVPKSANILVLGAGQGAFESRLLAGGYTHITAVDLYTKHKLADKVRFLKIDLNEREFSKRISGKYSVIIAMEVLEHLHNTYAFLDNCKKLLTKDGRIIVSTPNVSWSVSRVDYVLTGRPTLFITKPGLGDHVNPVFLNILEHHCEQLLLEVKASYPYGNFWGYFGAYQKCGIRSWIYLAALGLLSGLLYITMVRNRAELSGLDRIRIIGHRR